MKSRATFAELAKLTPHTRQAALERQDSSCTHMAHHELENVNFIIIYHNYYHYNYYDYYFIMAIIVIITIITAHSFWVCALRGCSARGVPLNEPCTFPTGSGSAPSAAGWPGWVPCLWPPPLRLQMRWHPAPCTSDPSSAPATHQQTVK